MTSYSDVARRWIDRTVRGSTKQQLRVERMPVSGDSIFSYGTHFEIARLIRDKKGQASHFLINGNTFSSSTSNHQSTVRNAIAFTQLPSVIIPHAALAQAGIILDTIRIVEVTPDRHEIIEHLSLELPAGAYWDYETTQVPGSGGYQHRETGEWIPSYSDKESRVNEQVGRYDWKAHTDEAWAAHVEAKRLADRQWVEQPTVTKRTGRKTLRLSKVGWRSWELVDVDGQVAYRRETTRHWLGESLISAEVSYRVVDRKSGALVTRRRRAQFLSGFDRGETRPSYFFCELPPGSRATTVEEALEVLKPSAVRLAEDLGREVKRQGDIFGVPVNVNKRALTASGATFEKGGRLFGTNHVATETALTKDGQLYARGALRHDPFGRRPDHKRVTLGKQWHLIVKNTVPVAA